MATDVGIEMRNMNQTPASDEELDDGPPDAENDALNGCGNGKSLSVHSFRVRYGFVNGSFFQTARPEKVDVTDKTVVRLVFEK